MANDESILREVDQELAEERQWAFFARRGPAVIGAGAAIVLAVAGFQIWNAQKSAAAARSAASYQEALTALEDDPEAGRAALEAFGENAPRGYAVLAGMRRAGALAAAGRRAQALAIYREIYGERAAPKRISQLARLRAGLLALEDGRDAVMRDLGDLEADPSALGFHAREIAGVAALQAGDYATAVNIFDALSASLETPASLRARAEEFAALAEAGKAGANLTRDLQADDLAATLDALQAEGAAGDGASVVDAAGRGVPEGEEADDGETRDEVDPRAGDSAGDPSVEGSAPAADPAEGGDPSQAIEEPDENTAGADENAKPKE